MNFFRLSIPTLVGGSVGRQMPQGAAPLDTIDLTDIMNWINNGAQSDLEL